MVDHFIILSLKPVTHYIFLFNETKISRAGRAYFFPRHSVIRKGMSEGIIISHFGLTLKMKVGV